MTAVIIRQTKFPRVVHIAGVVWNIPNVRVAANRTIVHAGIATFFGPAIIIPIVRARYTNMEDPVVGTVPIVRTYWDRLAVRRVRTVSIICTIRNLSLNPVAPNAAVVRVVRAHPTPYTPITTTCFPSTTTTTTLILQVI